MYPHKRLVFQNFKYFITKCYLLNQLTIIGPVVLQTTIFCCFIINTCSAQITFQKTFGNGTDWNYGYSVEQTNDFGYIMTGYTLNAVTGQDIYLTKTDVNGDTLWSKIFGGAEYEVGYNVHQLLDGGYVIAGGTTSFGSGDMDVYVIRTDISGDLMWSKTFGGAEFDNAQSIQETTDSSFIIAGWTMNFGAGEEDVYLIKINVEGELLWSKTFGRTKIDKGFSVSETTDGGYIIAGYSQSLDPSGYDVYLIKTDVNGDSLWTKTIRSTGYDFSYSVKQTSDGGYIIAGSSSFQSYLIKTDENGNIIWTKTYGGEYFYLSAFVEQTSDGGYIMGGKNYYFGDELTDFNLAFLIKTNSEGDTLWTRTYEGTHDQAIFGVDQTQDHGYILAGQSFFDFAGYKSYLIKTDSNGNTACSVEIPGAFVDETEAETINQPSITNFVSTLETDPATITAFNEKEISTICINDNINSFNQVSPIYIYPNPFNTDIEVIGITENGWLRIIDVIGKEILIQEVEDSHNQMQLNLTMLKPGIYLLNYQTENTNHSIQIIKYNP